MRKLSRARTRIKARASNRHVSPAISPPAAQNATDRSGANLVALIDERKILPSARVAARACVPDDVDEIELKLRQWSDELALDLILTTGGTGFAPRDVTPEATRRVIEREAVGLTMGMLKGGDWWRLRWLLVSLFACLFVCLRACVIA